MTIDAMLGGFEPLVFFTLIATSFMGSFITVALGIGGGVLLLAVMASLMPPATLIPVHGVIQFGSNLFRAALLLNYAHWPPFMAFILGTAGGAAFGGSVVVSLPPSVVQVGVGAFVIFSVLTKPPAWISRLPFITGALSSFLTMFFGATGVFVANFTKSLNLPRKSHVATHALMMTAQHVVKVIVFGILGFQFGPWAWFICAMILAGLLGTLAGRQVLHHIGDLWFRRGLDIILVVMSARLIWLGATGFI